MLTLFSYSVEAIIFAPMTSSDHHDERTVRIQKIQALHTLGINPYPDKFTKKQDIADIRLL
ncbi:MAG: hypothetical protein WCK88_03530 [bacterium]